MKKGLIAAIFTIVAFAGHAFAEVELKSVAEVEVTVKNEKGEKEVKRVAADKANVTPSDTVIFTNYYTNKGDKPATDVVITNPVPDNMVYVDKTAEGKEAKIEFSVDKGKSYGLPEKLVVKDKDGKERAATGADYTNIRWTVKKPVVKGGAGSVSFRAKVK